MAKPQAQVGRGVDPVKQVVFEAVAGPKGMRIERVVQEAPSKLKIARLVPKPADVKRGQGLVELGLDKTQLTEQGGGLLLELTNCLAQVRD